ncbi:sigma factor [Fusobacterium perfoetens]|uniref:sigma factor n=1 Tax=Fusobacterium perfoetens TaxID=852 RepID=UPI000482008E|nr:sigma factor [Fusobacterium perfoetens]
MLIENFERFVFEKYRDNNEFANFLIENLDFDVELERENEFLVSKREVQELENDDVLDYLEEINLYEPLTEEEYQNLSNEIEEEEVREKLLIDNFNEVARIALYFVREGVEYLELIQEGIMGAVEAINRYTYDNGDIKKYIRIWAARQMGIYTEERFEQIRQEFLFYFTKTHMDEVEITNEDKEKKIKIIENLSIDDVLFTLSYDEIKTMEYYFGLGYDKRYSVLEIEKEMGLEKNKGEELFTKALAKISSRDGRMFSL